MVSTITKDNCYKLVGLSSDEKPVENIGNGSTFFEIDTSTLYMFDEDAAAWQTITAQLVYSL